MGSRKLRITSLFVALAAALAVMGLAAPGAWAEVGVHVTIVNQPADAGADDLITGNAFDPSGGDAGYVQVQVTETVLVPDIEGEGFHEETNPVVGAEVTFALATGAGLATTDELVVESRFTNSDGNATFGPEEGSDNPLSIGDENQPFTTDYRLIPVATPPGEGEPPVEGDASAPFDIWGDGCRGNGCSVNLTPGTSSTDTYTTSENVGMGASQVGNTGTTLVCPTQQVIFSTNLFFHATTGNGPVFLVTHISEADRKAASNNGNKDMGWCLGLKVPGPWNFARQDTNGNGSIGAGDLFVGMAPKCPNKNAMNFAPCFVSKMGDGVGGTFIRGWVPGGDPPRRT